MTEKQVVKKEEATAVAEFDTSMFEADASAGIQNISNEDMALPFLKIVSGLDGILDERDGILLLKRCENQSYKASKKYCQNQAK